MPWCLVPPTKHLPRHMQLVVGDVRKGVGLLFVENFCTKPLQKKVLKVKVDVPELKVHNGEVMRAVQNLYPLEQSSTEEFPSKFNQNCRCENISPEQTPFEDAPVKSDGNDPSRHQVTHNNQIRKDS
ncbi:hypothetical protein AVEN_35494-1 [Araneus ventricosus]|uniref:Uncharacterized protein n=1 Tax=Araneus ventricosus TaxID=182803 RepID=A0A4Y2IU70_ARAVE|nr:hypothetical protein AVEN_35494-1 [Araneus ventricosus]